MTSNVAGLVVVTVALRRPVTQDRDLAEEGAGAERRQLVAVGAVAAAQVVGLDSLRRNLKH